MAAPGKWVGWAGLTVVALLLGLLLAGGADASSGAPPPALACPSGETVWLRGTATPGAALLAQFNGTVVGGGSAGADGAWALPLTVRERSGVYPVAVVARQGGELLAAFTCYVDLPLGATATTTSTARPTRPAAATPRIPSESTTQSLPRTSPLRPSPTASPTTTAIPGAAESDLPPLPTATAPVDPGATVAPEPSAEGSPISPNTLVVVAVQPDDPEEPGLFEYIIVENQTTAAQTLDGWQLIHRETGEAFAIPALTIPPGELLIVWSGDGEDEPDAGILHWPGANAHWSPGQTIELRAPDGQIVSTLVVPDANSAER
ncbi:MAG TPA: lamin tail domain-containing protein [Chloroflexaceae bacterium]|nr:lamin tail domain-containing protein [Chloroflexaceae bacterium]